MFSIFTGRTLTTLLPPGQALAIEVVFNQQATRIARLNASLFYLQETPAGVRQVDAFLSVLDWRWFLYPIAPNICAHTGRPGTSDETLPLYASSLEHIREYASTDASTSGSTPLVSFSFCSTSSTADCVAGFMPGCDGGIGYRFKAGQGPEYLLLIVYRFIYSTFQRVTLLGILLLFPVVDAHIPYRPERKWRPGGLRSMKKPQTGITSGNDAMRQYRRLVDGSFLAQTKSATLT